MEPTVTQPAAPAATPPVADRNAPSPELLAKVEALRARIGMAPVPAPAAEPAKVEAPAAPVAPVAPARARSEEDVLRDLAEEQLRLSRERRALADGKKADDESRTAEKTRLARLDSIEAAMQSGNRIALIRALNNGEIPDGELGTWAQEVAVAMSGDATVTPEDIDKLVERKLAAERKAEADRVAAADAERAAVRNEANQNYMRALDSALRAEAVKFPALNRFGVKAERVISLIEESFKTSNGQDVISIPSMLERLESDLKADILATPYGQPPKTETAPPPGALQPTTQVTSTPPTSDQPTLSLAERESKARAEILAEVRRLTQLRAK